MALIQKAFSDIITFSRSSNATRIGPTGLVEYAPHNLLLRSQEFDNASWAKTSGSITANAIAAPDGTITADKYTPSASNSYQLCYQVAATYGTYTFSVYAKAGEYTQAMLWTDKPITFGISAFNLSNGTIVQQGDGHTNVLITSVGNGWYRCSITAATTSGTPTFYVGIAPSGNTGGTFAGDGTSGGYLWGAQLSVGPYPLDYTPTTSAAVYGPRFDYDGSGVTIVESVSTNLLLYSQEFDNAYWTKTNATVTANSTTAPDETTTAETFTGSGTTGKNISRNTGLGAGTYAISIYAKPNGYDWVFIELFNGTTDYGAWFNVTTGAVGSSMSGGGTASITSVGNGWYRCSVVVTIASGTMVYAFGSVNADNTFTYTANGTSGAYFWGAQLEVGSTATAYMVSGATNGFRAVPVVSGSATPKGLLIEEQRTNLITNSQVFSTYNQSSASTVDNTIADPSGITNAATNTAFIGSGEHWIWRQITTSSGTYTFSVFAKAGTNSFFGMSLSGSASEYGALTCNLSTGVITKSDGAGGATLVGSSITALANGWYRISITVTLSGSNPIIGIHQANSATPTYGNYGTSTWTAAGTETVNIWGAQLEQGSFSTSYIPTVAASVTRSADVASVDTLSPWFNSVEGSLFAEYDTAFIGGGTPYAAEFNDGTVDNRITLYAASTSQFAFVASGGAAQANPSAGTIAINSNIKAAFAYKANDFALSANGSSASTDTSGTIPTVSSLSLGRLSVGPTNFLNGHVRRIAYYPVRLTAAQLQALTA